MENNGIDWELKSSLIHEFWETVTYQEDGEDFNSRNRVRKALETWFNQLKTGQIKIGEKLSFQKLLSLSSVELTQSELFESTLFLSSRMGLMDLEFWVIENEINLFKIDGSVGSKLISGEEIEIDIPLEYSHLNIDKSMVGIIFTPHVFE